MTNFKAAAVFSDNMVLQREKAIKVFGFGNDGAKVTVTLGNNQAVTTVEGEKWLAVLPPMEAGINVTMTITCDEEKIEFKNIAIGEVWLAGGQSNMEFELQNCIGGQEILKQSEMPNIRFYYTPKNAYKNEQFYREEEASHWELCGEEGMRYWSAVGYFFAKKVSEELGVTVGIVGCNWGGTSASVWMTRESLLEDTDTKTIMDAYDEAVFGKSEEQQLLEMKEYMDYYTVWNKKVEKAYQENPEIEWDEVIKTCGENKYPGPLCCGNQIRPCGLYETMLKRVMPYTMRGFLYYQGEDDEKHPKLYYKLLTRLIRQWREDWEDESMPFMIVQLPMFKYKADPDTKSWCYIREAQMKTFETVKNTGIAVIIDCGQFNEIHPKNKYPVGERIALQALCNVYQTVSEKEAYGPMFEAAIPKERKIQVIIKHAENGLEVKGEAIGFEIAGADKNYVTADVKIEGNSILLSNKEVSYPKYARYCWTNYGEVSVFGKNGLPLSPFRSSVNDEKHD